jgi:hypothetical protein
MRDKDYTTSCFFYYYNTEVRVIFRDAAIEISDCQKNSFDDFVLRQKEISEEIMESIFEYYKEAYPDYLIGWSSYGTEGRMGEIIEENLPKPESASVIKSKIQPLSIYFPNESECENGYFGIYFDCTWDINNSLGVRIKKWKVERVGNGDVAFLF